MAESKGVLLFFFSDHIDTEKTLLSPLGHCAQSTDVSKRIATTIQPNESIFGDNSRPSFVDQAVPWLSCCFSFQTTEIQRGVTLRRKCSNVSKGLLYAV